MKINSMKTSFSLLAAFALAGSLQISSAADVTGKITLKGTPPPEKPITLDAVCGKMQPDGIKSRFYVVGDGGALANVFVYIKEGAKASEATGEGPVLDQVGCQYQPYVLGVQTGQKIKIRNSDATLHNVHATPKLNKEFNFAQVTKGQINERAFEKSEVMVRMKCDVHPWMFAYVGVVDHPYFAVTGADGSFKLPGVPAGKYTVEAFHMKAGSATKEITVGADGNVTADFTFEYKAPVATP